MRPTLFLLTFGILLAPGKVNGQTSDTNPQLAAGLNRFPNADANGDGKLTAAEAEAYLQKAGPRLIKRRPELDANEDGKLSITEVAVLLGKGGSNQSAPAKQTKPAKAPQGGEKFIYREVDGVPLPLYVFGSDPARTKPAIVFFFGGGWSNGSPTQFEQHCKHLASRGMVAATVEYRVSSRYPVKVEDCVEDAKSAMRWVRSNAPQLGIDPERIASGGGSAGGHLAACTMLINDFNAKTDDLSVSPKPDAMVLFNPALVVAPDSRMTSQEIKRIEAIDSRARTSMKNVSPLNFAPTKQPPMIMFFGTNDQLMKGAKFFMQDSEAAGNSCELVTYEGQAHGFFNQEPYRGLTMKEMDDFLVDLGWLHPQRD
ncbi:MAG: alpha/beta hydrolase fold domain-containing protein [Planctomycetota bacterium]